MVSLTLYVKGIYIISPVLLAKNVDSSYAVAFLQFIIGLKGFSVLCIFIKLQMLGRLRLQFINFHLYSVRIDLINLLIARLISCYLIQHRQPDIFTKRTDDIN